MYATAYAGFMNYARQEGFTATGGDSGAVVLAGLAILLMIVVQLFIVQFLWNTVLTRVVSVVRPLPSLVYTLGLLVLVAMILPGAV